MSVRTSIETVFTEVATELNRKLQPLSDDLPLSESGLDSLCLAIIVARLENILGVDPFSASDETEIPTTFGQIVVIYENAVA
jgi:acyl carrier protein